MRRSLAICWLLAGCGGGGGGGNTDVDAPADAGDVALTVSATGLGAGMVTSSVGSIACSVTGGTCSANVPAGGEVTLSAVADAGYVFAGWAGEGCRGTGTCTVQMTQRRSVHATFILLTYVSRRALDGMDLVIPTTNVWRALTTGADRMPLTSFTVSGINVEEPRWSPDGTKILFYAAAALDGTNALNTNTTYNLWTVGSGGLKPLTTDTTGFGTYAGRWSPDGTKIAFVRGNAAMNRAELWIMDADGANPRMLTTGASDTDVDRLAWSPDSSKIAFESTQTLDGTVTSATLDHYNIWVIGADGTGLLAITTTATSMTNSYDPAWSPDGTRLAFESQRKLDGTDAKNPTLNVWTANPSGGGLVTVTNFTAVNCYEPTWSPDGASLAFMSNGAFTGADQLNSGSAQNVWTVHPDGSALTPATMLVDSSLIQNAPSWSPDGSQLAYETRRKLDGSDAYTQVFNLWILGATGANPHHVTDATVNGADSRSPQWRIP